MRAYRGRARVAGQHVCWRGGRTQERGMLGTSQRHRRYAAIQGRIIPGEKWMTPGEAAREAKMHGYDSNPMQAVIKVIGVGGGGSNVVNRMMDDNIQGIEAWVINTDAQALESSRVPVSNRIQIGAKATRGLGAGGNPALGLEAAKESRAEIEAALHGADMVFVTAGLGGGTGSGAAPYVCEVAQAMKILTVAVATLPFSFEGRRRTAQAVSAREAVQESSDTTIIVTNDMLLDSAVGTANLPVGEAFKFADQALTQGVRGITDIIMVPGMINVDFADVKAIMSQAGTSHMAHGRAGGRDRAERATLNAISTPCGETAVRNALGVVWNVTGPADLTLMEVNEAAAIIHDLVDRDDANIIFGAVIDPTLKDEVVITLIATGFTEDGAPSSEVLRLGKKQGGTLPASTSAVPSGSPRVPSFLKKQDWNKK